MDSGLDDLRKNGNQNGGLLNPRGSYKQPKHGVAASELNPSCHHRDVSRNIVSEFHGPVACFAPRAAQNRAKSRAFQGPCQPPETEDMQVQSRPGLTRQDLLFWLFERGVQSQFRYY